MGRWMGAAALSLSILFLGAAGPGPAAGETGGTYGVVERVQVISRQVAFRPIGKRFEKGSEIVYYDRYGDPVCTGSVRSVYENEAYSLADNCDRLEEIGPGSLVGAGGSPEEVRRVMQERTEGARAARERADREVEAGDPKAVPIDVGRDRYEEVVVNSPLPVLLEFTADWCPASRRAREKVAELARRLAGKVRVVTMDYDIAPERAEELNVARLPAFLVLRKGIVQEQWTGLEGSPAQVARRLIGKYADR